MMSISTNAEPIHAQATWLMAARSIWQFRRAEFMRSKQIGIADESLRHAIPMRGRMIHDRSGALHFAAYDVDPRKCINSIGRASLNAAVIEAAQRYPNVRAPFQSQNAPTSIWPKQSVIGKDRRRCRGDSRSHKSGNNQSPWRCCDRPSMAPSQRCALRCNETSNNFQYEESYLAHGYKELTIPPATDGSWRIEKNALHIWPAQKLHDDCPAQPGWVHSLVRFSGNSKGPRSFATTKQTDDDVPALLR